MSKRGNAVHITTQRRHYTDKDGQEKVYETHLLRRSWRDGGKVRNETVANLSHLPSETIELIRRSLAGEQFVPAGDGATVARSLSHGHVAAVHAVARALGFPALLGPPSPERNLAYALIISRVVRPASTLSTAQWWEDVTLGPDLGVAGSAAGHIAAALGWLAARQDDIERQLADRHLHAGEIALLDLSRCQVEGTDYELTAPGPSRDGRPSKPRIEYGLLTDKDSRPVAVQPFSYGTTSPKAFSRTVGAVRRKFGLETLIVAGNWRSITSARIKELQLQEAGIGWLTGLRYTAISRLTDGNGMLRLSVSDYHDLVETSGDLPRRRLVAGRIEERAKAGPWAAADGIYVIHTSVPAKTLEGSGTIAAYEELANLERDFGRIEAEDLGQPPGGRRIDDRVRAHMLICMLACYLTWHLRQAWAPLTALEEHRPEQPMRSVRDVLDHLAMLTRNDLRTRPATVPVLTEPTPSQRRAFELLSSPIPLTIALTWLTYLRDACSSCGYLRKGRPQRTHN
jgi:hypothetical protein